MNKAFYIVGIVFSVIFMFVVGYYAEEVSDARLNYMFSDIFNSSSYGYDSYSYTSYSSMYGDSYEDLTVEAGLWSIFFFLCFIAIDLLGLLKVKTKTTKVLSIIGLSFSGIFFFWNFGLLTSPGSMSFDEVSGGWIFYCMLMLAFTIIGLVQSVRYGKQVASGGAEPVQNGNGSDLLDS